MSDDIYRILENLDAAQRSVKQLPALFKPANTSPQLAGPYPGKNATLGYLVGEDKEPENAMRQAVTRRIVNQHPEWIMTYGVDALMQAINDVTEGDTDFEEIGSSDVSSYVRDVKNILDDRMASRDDMADRQPFAEAKDTATEDVLDAMKRRLGDYLQDVASAIKKDPDLKDRIPQDIDQIRSVKTLRTDDGHEIKITGNEDDGFRVTIKNRQSRTKFPNLDEATMAVEMYCARRSSAAQSQDYIEEA